MTQSRSARKSQNLQKKTAELAEAAPQVIAKRLGKLAAAGPMLSKQDHHDLQEMVSEKQSAFTQSWLAMSMQMVFSQQELAMKTMKSMAWPKGTASFNIRQATDDAHSAALDVLEKGLDPIHKTAVANAKLLNKKK